MNCSPALARLDPVPRAPRLLVGIVLALAINAAFVLVAFAETANPVDLPRQAAASGLGDELEREVRQLAMDSVPGAARTAGPQGTTAGKLPGAPVAPRIEISVGQLDARLRLAPCAHVEPYLPEGTRLWGKARIGLRCTQGASRWNVYLPITVKAFGPALVAAGNLSAGSVLTSADLAPAEVDLAEDTSAPVLNAELAVGRVLARPMKAGQSLRLSHIKPRQWFAAGDAVTVMAQGEGFSVSGEGQALTNGIEGQPARVRTESGRVLTGHPVGERRMELIL
jgi:flagella basal body P-ring formation protein FlgA